MRCPSRHHCGVATSALPRSQVLDLAVDDLAFEILRHLTENPASASRTYVTSIYTWQPIQLGLPWDKVSPRVVEAWDLLLWLGLLSPVEPDENGIGMTTITERGREIVANDSNLTRARAERRLELGLHPLLDNARTRFSRRDYEGAVLFAMREIEIEVRRRASLSAADIGVDLMRKAFNPQTGALRDPSLLAAENEATSHLFAGAMGFFKNPSSHREVDLDDPTVVAGILLFADLLLRMLDAIEARLAQGTT
jgi:uncharacterized protein (TIGR02391 family)